MWISSDLDASPSDLCQWDIFKGLDPSTLEKIECFHVFGTNLGTKGNNALFYLVNGEVYGFKSSDTAKAPLVKVDFLTDKGINGFSSGDGFVNALTKNGLVFTSGANDKGQLGQTKGGPNFVQFDDPDVLVQQVSSGRWHTLALTRTGAIYSWGDNAYGQCGTPSPLTLSTPKRVQIPDSITVASVKSGMYHSAAVTTTGEVYTWGSDVSENHNRYKEDQKIKPQLVSSLKNVKQVACGMNHTVVLTEDGQLYASLLNGQSTVTENDVNSLNTFKHLNNLPRVLSVWSEWKNDFCVAQSEGRAFVLKFQRDSKQEIVKKVDKKKFTRAIEVFYNSSSPCCRIRRVVFRDNVPFVNVPTFFNNSYLSDVIIEVGNTRFFCHSFILKVQCPHYNKLLSKAPDLEGRKLLQIRNYSAETYKAFIEYIYTGVLKNIDAKNIIELWDISETYSVDFLKDFAAENFSGLMDVDNAVQLYEEAFVKKLPEMQSTIRRFIAANVDKVFSSKGIEKVKPEILKHLVIGVFRLRNSQ